MSAPWECGSEVVMRDMMESETPGPTLSGAPRQGGWCRLLAVVALVAVIVLTRPSAAQDAGADTETDPIPGIDCAAPAGALEKLMCDNPDLMTREDRLAERYAVAVQVAGGLTEDNPRGLSTLVAAHAAWRAERDACAEAEDPRACVEEAYRLREVQLAALYMLERPTRRATYACGEGNARVYAVFFDTDPPAVRLERGGRIVNGVGSDTDIIIASAKAYIEALNLISRGGTRQHPQVADV